MSQFTYLYYVLTLQLASELQDEMTGTSHYKQEVKQKINSLKQSIDPILKKELPAVLNVDEELMINVLRHQEQLIKRIATLDLGTLMVYNEQLTKLEASDPQYIEYTPLSA